MSDPLGLVSGVGGSGAIRPNIARTNPAADDANGASFKDVLLKNIEEVNKLQQDATKAVEDLQTGKRTDMENVLSATAKADMAFKALQAVRNQVLRAYDEIQQMRV
jgi:flagellar hook-basal body complex protein FliE